MTRAYDPWPVARTTLGGEELMLWRVRVVDNPAPFPPQLAAAGAGTIVALKPAPLVRCGVGTLALLEVQAAGRRRMAAADFMRGRRVATGARLGA
jgi:methionyl-tRNA formyltransferase